MIVNRDLARREKQKTIDAAERAVRRYGLYGASIVPEDGSDDAVYTVNMPATLGPLRHPYLGRVDGKQFILKLRDNRKFDVAASVAEVVWLARLLLSSDMELPEPVPACDGSLVVELPGEELDRAFHSILLRWPPAPAPALVP